jgi:glycosyltransferase involved in cell wall biosynthesis
MKILFIHHGMHHKNLHTILHLYKNIEFESIDSIAKLDEYDLTQYDCVFSPSDPIDISKYPGVCFVFGPHFSVFPDQKVSLIQSNKTAFIILSDWVKKVWESFPICNRLHLVDIPFAIDVDRFCEIKLIQERSKVFIYYKSRYPEELEFIESFLKFNRIPYKIFSYKQRYNESDYLEYLQQAKFGIWIDAHESQGFALEEALSCNVPLLVWNIRSMNQEYKQNYQDIPATTIPYWDERCGEYFYDMNDFQSKCNRFFSRLESYRPREYIIEQLSPSVCETRFIDMVSELKQKVNN